MFERTRRWIESESAVRGCADDDAERRRRGSVISRAVGVLLRLDRTHRIFRHVVENIHRATTPAASHPTFDYPRGVSTVDTPLG